VRRIAAIALIERIVEVLALGPDVCALPVEGCCFVGSSGSEPSGSGCCTRGTSAQVAAAIVGPFGPGCSDVTVSGMLIQTDGLWVGNLVGFDSGQNQYGGLAALSCTNGVWRVDAEVGGSSVSIVLTLDTNPFSPTFTQLIGSGPLPGSPCDPPTVDAGVNYPCVGGSGSSGSGSSGSGGSGGFGDCGEIPPTFPCVVTSSVSCMNFSTTMGHTLSDPPGFYNNQNVPSPCGTDVGLTLQCTMSGGAPMFVGAYNGVALSFVSLVGNTLTMTNSAGSYPFVTPGDTLFTFTV
jgi:hypothetical protein